jgi:hypothetical protein
MCAVSWTSRREGYDLFFNRDERDARATEQPPPPVRIGTASPTLRNDSFRPIILGAQR